MHKTWIKSISRWTYNLRNEREKNSNEKRMIKRLLHKADEKCPPINFKTYEAKHFKKYLLSLDKNCGRRLNIPSYCNERSTLSQLFRIYETKPSKKLCWG